MFNDNTPTLFRSATSPTLTPRVFRVYCAPTFLTKRVCMHFKLGALYISLSTEGRFNKTKQKKPRHYTEVQSRLF